jgi:hypothetical protein
MAEMPPDLEANNAVELDNNISEGDDDDDNERENTWQKVFSS